MDGSKEFISPVLDRNPGAVFRPELTDPRLDCHGPRGASMTPSKSLNRLIALALAWGSPIALATESTGLKQEVAQQARAQEAKVIAWRRDIHAHPELGNQEQRTSALVAEHLRTLGLEVRTGVARTGVVGILRGGRPGRVVALRADMDALPVKEPQGLPSASTARSTYLGRTGGCHARLRTRRPRGHPDGGGP